jgi:hypothetical protein
MAEGLRVKSGEHAVKCRSLRLFHRSQCEPVSKQEQAKYLQEREAKVAAKSSASRLPAVSPVAASKAA